MAPIIRFPQERCSWPVKQTEPCLILILPSVRIERSGEAAKYHALELWLIDWWAENR